MAELIGHERRRSTLLRLFTSLTALALSAGQATTAGAAQPTFALIVDSDLRFGSFVVMSTGARIVSATGAVTNISIYPIASGVTGPAQFTVAYDRGNNGNKVLDVTMEVSMGAVPAFGGGGVTGTLSGFTTDMPGVPAITPGQIIPIRIIGCRTRICSRTFRIGSRIDVSRSGTGRVIAIPIPMTATLVNVR